MRDWDDGARLEIDAADRVCSTDPDWHVAPGTALPRPLVGELVWQCLPAGPIPALYEVILEATRLGRTATIDLWADEPTCRRRLELVVARRADVVQLELRQRFERPRSRLPLFDPDHPRSDDTIVRCGWCGRLNALGWVDGASAIRQLGLGDGDPQPELAAGCCAECEKMVYAACRMPRLRQPIRAS